MNTIYSLIYNAQVNWLIRNVNYILASFLPKKIKIHPSGTLKISVKNHSFIKLKTNQTSYVTRELFWKGSANYEYTPVFLELAKRIDTFFDVGSSIGYYSILGASINQNLKVEAFEPSIGSMTYLRENIKINNLDSRVHVNVLALSDQPGQVDFFEVRNSKYPNIPNLSGEHNLGTKPDLVYNKAKIDADTLDNFVSKSQIQHIDLIKVDTEGSEDLILKCSFETITKFKPIIICETLFNKIESKLEKIMRQHDYEFYNHHEDGLYKVTTLERKSDNGVRNCFFVHSTKKHLIEDFIVG